MGSFGSFSSLGSSGDDVGLMVGSALDTSLIVTKIAMMVVAAGALTYLGTKAVRDKRAGRNIVTIDVFVGATLACDLLMLVSWCASNYLVSDALQCKISFVIDYIGGIGG
ncbi:hypothetical protein KIPB_008601 [Kipferlia bialata]|uniref:Uncharacterized protein n=1 Tax=Kipferlia bialata TaxID=797122 RepID=A0A9K3D0X0_9EUKA|nr:hypothetical protein KIPB_008601 [Kipferlia bialata]|eukprot:g8601.t1